MAARLFIRRTEAAHLLRCDPRTIDRGIEQGLIPAVRINTAVRIPFSAFCEAVSIDPDVAAADLADFAPVPKGAAA